MNTRPPITVAIVDDAELIIQGLRTMLHPHSGSVEVIASAIGVIPRVPADILIVDAFGAADAGVERVREGLETGCFKHVVLLTWRLSTDRRRRAFDAGASGILSKSAPARQLVESLQQVSQGHQVEDQFPTHVWGLQRHDDTNQQLNEREMELLALTANGLSNAEVAQIMFIAPSTVKTYLKRVYRKIGVNNRAQATLRAVELGLAGPDSEFQL